MEGNNNQQGLYNVQQELEEGSSFDFKIIYTTLILNWQWFVLSLIICLSAAAIMLRYTNLCTSRTPSCSSKTTTTTADAEVEEATSPTRLHWV